MKNLKYLVPILFLGLGYLLLRQCSINQDLKRELTWAKDLKPETIRIDKPIKIPDPYPIEIKPKPILVYKTDTLKVPYPEYIFKTDTIRLSNNETNLDISKWFLLLYPQNDKLISIDFSDKKFDLSLLTIQGQTLTKKFNIDTQKYNYRYVDNKLTSEKKKVLKLEPSLGYQYRPINRFHDLDLSLSFKTTRFNYELGLNTFYYPKIYSEPKFDVFIKLKYIF